MKDADLPTTVTNEVEKETRRGKGVVLFGPLFVFTDLNEVPQTTAISGWAGFMAGILKNSSS